MKSKNGRGGIRFGAQSRFEVKPAPPAPFRAHEEDPLERLKRRLLQGYLEGVRDAETNCRLRRAANEAAALAWVTPYPLLVFPVLFEEQAQAAAARARRQAQVRLRSRELLGLCGRFNASARVRLPGPGCSAGAAAGQQGQSQWPAR